MTNEDDLTRSIIEAVIRVHSVLGPGFLEGIYQKALSVELTRRSLPFTTELDIPIRYEGELVGRHRLDLVVANRVVVELKTVEALGAAQYAQVRSYLKATGLPVGLLVNFSTERADYRRVTLKLAGSPPHPHSSPHPPSTTASTAESAGA
jgi:GxxExxY protein